MAEEDAVRVGNHGPIRIRPPQTVTPSPLKDDAYRVLGIELQLLSQPADVLV